VFQITANLTTPGKVYTAEEEGRNLFIVLDAVLKKVESQLG